MFGKLITALKNFLSGLFGTKSAGDAGSSGSTTATTQPSRPGTPPPRPPRPTAPPPEPDVPQDASELKPDTVVIVAHEMEEVVVVPGEQDVDHDDDLFLDEIVPITEEMPEPEPEAEPEPELSPVPAPPAHKRRYLWCLDNGHGSLTAGKRSPVFDDGKGDTQFFEYEFNRDIVARIITALEAKGVAYYNVVPEVEIDNFLQGRVDRANAKRSNLPKIFVSVHANAGPAQSSRHWVADSIKGIETWFFHGSKRGQKLAAVFQRHLIEETGLHNRHLKSRPDRQFYVLRKTAMPAVLTENGFYNNRHEVKLLLSDSMRQKIADAHVAAILEIEDNGI
jgi:N-acetylmuramoyl-L-alanine amidase